MNPNSTNLHVFVSCPSDVSAEKGIVEQVCKRINKNLNHTGCNIQFVYRDCSEVIGRAGTRPQQQINDSISGYDIYIGILHMRFGTPTGAANPDTGIAYESGTEEEYFLASERAKSGAAPSHIYFFFKKMYGSQNSQEHEQAGKVLRFKESLMRHDWVNSFEHSLDFEKEVNDLLTRIGYGLCLDSKNAVKKQIIEDMTFPGKAGEPRVDMSGFVPNIPDLDYYIPRSITEFRPGKDDFKDRLLGEETKSVFLREALLNERKIVLLGNAGSGKSVELQQAARYYLDVETPFIPVYKRFNTFSGQKIDNFLPEGWDQVSQEVAVILLDGLDEIQPQYFATAVKEILAFTDRNPDLRIVVSSRTNFYDLPTTTSSGTLTNFQTFILNDISLSEIRSYTTDNFEIDGQDFIYQAHKQSFLDLIQKPFFLDILLRHYKLKGNFDSGRAQIIEASILSRITLDKSHFKDTLEISVTKREVLTLLEKVAFLMEVMGKNFISDEELAIALKTAEVEQLKYFSAFNRNIENHLWMFEHNNIQEFLAARVLGRQSFDKLIKIISFAPSHNKVKPTWVNTLSFFISIGNTGLVQKLVDWMVDKEVEILVKFEPDRIGEALRIDLFKQIFSFYKERDIWLSSNKFNDDELARFASSTDALDFLIEEIANTSNTHMVRMNAISIVASFDYPDFEESYRQKVIDKLVAVLGENPDPNTIHSILYGLAKIGSLGKTTTDSIINKYSRRKNQYIRAGLYKLINESEYSEDYVDILLDGIVLNDMEAEDDRESVNLMDESWQLKEGLGGIKSSAGLKKILSYFKRSPDERRNEFYEKRVVFTSVLQNALAVYSDDKTMYHELYDVYITSGRSYEREYAKMIVPFFEQTDTKWQTFKLLWKDEKVKERYQKDFLLEQLIDEGVVANFLTAYTNREYSTSEAEKFHQLMTWQLSSANSFSPIIEGFEKKIFELSETKLEMPPRVDWNEINRKKAQDSFDILFSKADLLNEIEKMFSEIGKEELSSEDLWELRKDNSRELEDYFIGAAIGLLRDFATNGRTVKFEDVRLWTEEEPNFTDYIIGEIYQDLHGDKGKTIVVSPEQVTFISDWCKEAEGKYNIADAIDSDENSGRISINGRVMWLWFFVKYFKIRLTDQKLLDFTEFNEYQSHGSVSIPQQLEELIEKEKIAQRVTGNLKSSIADAQVWNNNALYAIENDLKDAYPSILRDLLDQHKRKHFRSGVLEAYFKKTMDFTGLQGLFNTGSIGDIRWDIVKLLAPFEAQGEFLSERLKKILQEKSELHEDKMKASKYLMELGDLDGLKYIAGYILSNDNKLSMDFMLQGIPSVNLKEAIPILMQLLKAAKQPPYRDDRFNRLEANVKDSLYQIGVQSEENYQAVKKAYEMFIEENSGTIAHLNFLHFDLQRIEEQMHLKKAQELTVSEAVKEFEDLSK